MKRFLKVMKALSDPGRVKIIKMLEHKPMCVCEIQASLALAQPTVSKHLKVLEDADLVVFIKDGLWVNYRLSEGSGNPYAAYLLENMKKWMNDEASISQLVARLPYINRDEICRK